MHSACSTRPSAPIGPPRHSRLLLPPDDRCRFGGGAYHDHDADDDFYWAAAELWLATGNPNYQEALLRSGLHRADVFGLDGFDFDRVAAPARLDLALAGPGLPDARRVRDTVVEAADLLVGLQDTQPWGQPYAPPDGWAWGSNGRILNNLVVLATADLLTGDGRYHDAVAWAWTTCSAATRSGRATSPVTAPTSPCISGPGSSPMILTPRSRRHPRCRLWRTELPAIPGLSVRLPPGRAATAGSATSTSRPPR